MNWATDEFNLIWENDQDLYLAVLAEARELLRRVPTMTDQTLGRNIKDRVFAWAYGGGWGYPEGWRGSPISLVGRDLGGPFAYFLDRDAYGDVSEEALAEEVRDALPLEGYDRTTGRLLDEGDPR